MPRHSVREWCVVTKNRYSIYKYIKMITALMAKSKNFINICKLTSVCSFDSWRSLLKQNFRWYSAYLGDHSVEINLFKWKNINYNVRHLNGNFAHIQRKNVYDKKSFIIFLTLGLIDFFLRLAIRSRTEPLKGCWNAGFVYLG